MNISDLAESVLAQVEQEQVVKTASVGYTFSTEFGNLMHKVAEELRAEAKDTSICYNDIRNFRARYGI